MAQENKFLGKLGLPQLIEEIKSGFAKLVHFHSISDLTDYTVDSEIKSDSENPVQNKVIKSALDEKVPITRTVNGKALNANINLTASDVGAANSSHKHDDVYYTETEIDSKLSTKSDTTHNHDDDYDAKGTASSLVNSTVSSHNTNTSAHNDIRTLINDLTTRLNALANSTDTELDQMAELVEYIKENRDLIEGVTTNKVNIADIVNNLTTNVSNKPLSAAQGVAIKSLIDELTTVVNGKANSGHTHDDRYFTESEINTKLDAKADKSHGIHVSYSTTAPVMDGTASVGTASTVARSDHKHPTDTSRASKTEFDSHTSDTTKHITSTERTNWNAAKTHADSAHAPSDAQKNQNAFSNIKVGSTTISADNVTDTLELVGSNVTITPDATNDKVTIGVVAGTTSQLGIVKLENSTSSTSTTTAATPSSVKSAYDLANTAKTNATTAQTRADSAYSLAESKVDSLADLGITATATELNYIDGVTSNVQTQLNNKATIVELTKAEYDSLGDVVNTDGKTYFITDIDCGDLIQEVELTQAEYDELRLSANVKRNTNYYITDSEEPNIVNDLVNIIYPIGSIYMSVNNVSPTSLFGGTWEQIKDTFLLSAGDTYTGGSVGGEASHTLTVDETPAHTHTRGTMNITGSFNHPTWAKTDMSSGTVSGAFTHGNGVTFDYTGMNSNQRTSTKFSFDASKSWTGATSSVGGSQPHNNMPPYLAVFVWKRIA